MKLNEISEGRALRIESLSRRLRESSFEQRSGRVIRVVGLIIESEGPLASLGEMVRIIPAQGRAPALAEVVGFRGSQLLLMPLGELQGVQPGSEVVAAGPGDSARIGENWMGRVVDGLGKALDGRGPLLGDRCTGIRRPPPHPLQRQRIQQVFRTGVKSIDTLIPCGCGQRMGIFAGSGVGKSTLLGMMAREAEADVNVIALIGERGREVREFLERDLDEAGRRKSVVIVATSNEPAPARLKGAFLAMSVAEYFRDRGRKVLLMMDSVTRFAMAQREIGLAVGEPPATRGYTPSVFALIPQLLERAGTSDVGSITGLFTVLVEGDDMNDPIADCVRSVLDGHIVLSRELATQEHYPAVDVLESVSRLTRDLLSPEQLNLGASAREALATYRQNRDLISVGAYVNGTNRSIDRALRLDPVLKDFLKQRPESGFSLEHSWEALRGALGVNSPAGLA